jgi:hypothetical protein
MHARFPVPVLFALALSLPANGADTPLGPVHYSPQCEAQRSRIASNGHTFYGAWTFVHSGLAFVSGSTAGGGIDEEGALMTLTQHTIAPMGAQALASDGTEYLIATDDSGTLNARLSGANGLFQGNPIPLASGFPTNSLPGSGVHSSVGVAWNGSHYVVIGTKATRDGSQPIHESLVAATISPDGQILGTRVIADAAYLLDLEPAGNGRVLVLMLAAGIAQSMLIDDSLATTTPVNVVARGNIQADVVSSGSGFLAVWSSGTAVEAVALDTNGVPRGAPFAVGTSPDIGLPMPPAVAWDGSSYLIVWWDNTLVGTRSNGNGVSQAFPIGSGYYPSVATNAAGDSVVLFTGGCGTVSSRVVRRGAMASEPAEHALSLNALRQGLPMAVGRADGTQIGWEENDASSTTLFTTFVRSDGTVGPLLQLTEDGSFSNDTVELTPLGGGTVAVWIELRAGVPGGLRLQRLDSSGNALTAPQPLGSTQAFFLGSAANGSNIGVAFTQASSSYTSDSWVAVADAAGNVHQTMLSPTTSVNKTIASIGEGFLVIWREDEATGSPLFSALIDRDANVLRKQLIVTDSHGPFEAALVSTDDGALLVWNDSEGSTFTLIAQQLDSTGAPQGTPFPLATSSDLFSHLRIAAEGDSRTITYLTSNGGNTPSEVRRTTIRGGAVSSPVTLVASSPGEAIQEYVLSGDRVSGIVISRSTTDAETNGAARLFWRPFAPSRRRASGH